ncbi:MAG: CoA pyrophosphatase [Heliobacteriaceae bacterium]|nr:CoA pyrophosphatase [Heliobacteriaceae bacterium]
MNILDRFRHLSNRKPGVIGQEDYFRSAVLLPLVNYQGELSLLFEKRAAHLNKQPGEICFPGGSVESADKSEADAAVRETGEELGLERKAIELIAPLDILIIPFNLIVYPFICLIKDGNKITPNASEVESVFYIPLSELGSIVPVQRQIALKPVFPADYPYELIPGGENYPWRAAYYPQYFYLWQDQVIWGITARILKHFLDLGNGG